MSEEIIAKYKNRINNMIKTLGSIFGYQVSVQDNKIVLLSLYAFSEEDRIVLVVDGQSITVEENEFVKRFKNEKHMYLENGRSLGAFLSAVTLSLFDQKTFQ
ncbi:hypothetical protein NECID01_0301 [Nematocida sp. AWRm77]|nr:hypothetical protein NECID01_0301 [Nematocida sp. AWRm77]